MKSLNFEARFIELAGEINSHMPDFVLTKITWALNQKNKSLNGSNVLLLGMAYKANVSDTRESPALDLVHLLSERGAKVSFHDPWVRRVELGGKPIQGKPYSIRLLKSMDVVVITTAHQTFNPQEILKHAKLVIDTRNLMHGLTGENLVRL